MLGSAASRSGSILLPHSQYILALVRTFAESHERTNSASAVMIADEFGIDITRRAAAAMTEARAGAGSIVGLAVVALDSCLIFLIRCGGKR